MDHESDDEEEDNDEKLEKEDEVEEELDNENKEQTRSKIKDGRQKTGIQDLRRGVTEETEGNIELSTSSTNSNNGKVTKNCCVILYRYHYKISKCRDGTATLVLSGGEKCTVDTATLVLSGGEKCTVDTATHVLSGGEKCKLILSEKKSGIRTKKQTRSQCSNLLGLMRRAEPNLEYLPAEIFLLILKVNIGHDPINPISVNENILSYFCFILFLALKLLYISLIQSVHLFK